MDFAEIEARVRRVVATTGDLGDACDIEGSTNLFDRGLTSLASVRILVALEEEFCVLFPDELLARSTFSTIDNLAEAVHRVLGGIETQRRTPDDTQAFADD